MASTSDAASTLLSNKPPYTDIASCDMKDGWIKTQFVTECDHSCAYKYPFPSRYVTHHEKEGSCHALSEVAAENFKSVKIIRALLLCGKQNIAIRGHTEERSNFMAILRELAEGDLVLKEHIQSTTARYKYTFPDVQNELLIICGKQISDKIVEDCNEAGFFSVLGDECTDKSTKEQMSICLRFIDPGSKDVREDFLCFVEPENTKGETIARCLLGTLEKESKVVVQRLRDERNDPAVWDALYGKAVEIAEEFELNPCTSRRAGRQIHRANHPVQDPQEYWKISLFYVFLDHLIQELESRLIHSEDRFFAEYLVPVKLQASVLLTMPASTATAERSFSAMNRIKTYWRTTMTTDCLSALAMLHIYRDVEIDRQNVITKFASVKGRKLNFCFHGRRYSTNSCSYLSYLTVEMSTF